VIHRVAGRIDDVLHLLGGLQVASQDFASQRVSDLPDPRHRRAEKACCQAADSLKKPSCNELFA